MSGGFILLHRSVLDHEAFRPEPFSEREAWIWLLMQASYEPHKIRWKSEMITVGRGDVPTSYRRLKDTWKWGNERVRRFLDLLESENMISRKTGTGFLVVSICNYDKYQDALRNSGTKAGTVVGTVAGTPAGTNITKETQSTQETKEKKDMPVSQAKPGDSLAFEKFWKAYPSTAGSKKKTLERWKQIRGEVKHEQIMRGLEGYLRNYNQKLAAKQFVPQHPYPQKWLGEERWREFLAVEEGGNGSVVAADKPKVITEAQKAKNIAFKRKVGLIEPAQQEWLEQYEKQHGRVGA